MVVGGGIAGIQASLDLGNSGYHVHLIEHESSIGGVMAQLDKTFPTNDCSMCIMSPKLVEVGRHKNIEIHTLADVEAIEGEKGRFSVSIRQRPRYVDPDKCIACGLCAEKCPVRKIPDEYNAGLVNRRAIHIMYPQAVPLKYAIDPDHCLKLTKDKCGNCAKVCPKGAIDYEDTEKRYTLEVGSIILSPGFKAFDPSVLTTYNYGRHKNIVTSVEFERMLSASGPTGGHLVRASDGADPKKIAWLQCVGSRDIHRAQNAHCSSVCCMYAIKEAIIAKEHAGDALDCSIFFMDMRTHGKDFEACYNDAREKHDIRFLRSRVHTVTPIDDDTLELVYIDDAGEIVKESFDIVVLSVGLESDPTTIALARKTGIALTPGHFADTGSFSPVATSRDGIYVCGAFAGPKDIPQSVIEASSAAQCAGADLIEARGEEEAEVPSVPERNAINVRPRIGVFVCHCGTNIGGVVDVEAVAEYVRTLPFVEYATTNLYTCSQDTQDQIAQIIQEKGLNRVVVAACTPKTHEVLFQQTLQAAGLNKYLFEFANIRNHASWVHKKDPALATQKSKELVRMAVAKAACLEPLSEAELEIEPTALVLGGGIAGMSAARALSAQGYPVHLVERETALGGQVRSLHETWRGEDIQAETDRLIEEVMCDANIAVHLDTTLENVEGFVGNFVSTLKTGEASKRIEHGVAIIATGAKPHVPTEYLYGKDVRILTHQELDRRFIAKDAALAQLDSAAFIQCVGSREPGRPYCSRVCCTHTVQSALQLKTLNPEMKVYVLYRDIRTYGERERLYQKAREAGVIFIRFGLENKPVVAAGTDGLEITVTDHVLQRPVRIRAGLLTLATAIEPMENASLGQQFKVSVNHDGFFLESHVKLAPSDFATDGVFLCGMAHYPKPIDEAVAQAQAAASRATTLLARQKISISGNVAWVKPDDCSGCGTCVDVCPYNAPSFLADGPYAGRSEINPMLCKGCGLCVASCRSGAIHLKGFDQNQVMVQIAEAI